MILFQLILASIFSFSANTNFYPQSYQQGREVFRARSVKLKKDHFENALYGNHTVPTKLDIKLTTDFIYIPQNSAEKTHLFILTSGTHGAEAFAGSAIQNEFLNELSRSPQLLDKMGVLIVHAVNPYGFHMNRRVTENNIDLNRNFIHNPDDYQTERPEYEKLTHFLNPKEKLNYNLLTTIKVALKSVYLLITQGRQTLTNAVVGGQYSVPKGVFYGGKHPEENVLLIKDLFRAKAADYKNILHVDLHTGYGERGTLHFFTTNKLPQDVLKNRDRIFQGYKIDSGDDKNFYDISGEFTVFTMNILEGKSVIPMTFEFGTSDSQTTLGGMFSLRTMIQENQAFHYGTTTDESKKNIKKDFSELFNPSDEEWRKKVMLTAKDTLDTVLGRFTSEH